MAADLGLCPSARPDDLNMADKAIFGIVGGTAEVPQVRYLPDLVPITDEMIEVWRESPVAPGEIMRATGRCKGEGCRQWNESTERWSLIDRWLIAIEPGPSLPDCALRPACRAWQQHKAEACWRCPNFASQTITGLAGDPLQRINLEKVYV